VASYPYYLLRTVSKVPRCGGVPVILVPALTSTPYYPYDIAVDDTSVYFTAVDGTIRKLTPK
jgi:hypothetical protein